jgi:hypothetical protein
MPSVRLRTNMIIEGKPFPFGTVMDEEKIPRHLRKRAYILRPGERDIDEERFAAQEKAAIVGQEPIIEEDQQTEEDAVRIRNANRRGIRR